MKAVNTTYNKQWNEINTEQFFQLHSKKKPANKPQLSNSTGRWYYNIRFVVNCIDKTWIENPEASMKKNITDHSPMKIPHMQMSQHKWQ